MNLHYSKTIDCCCTFFLQDPSHDTLTCQCGHLNIYHEPGLVPVRDKPSDFVNQDALVRETKGAVSGVAVTGSGAGG